MDSPLERFIAVMQAELDRLRADYDVRIVHGKAHANLEQRCKRCGLWILLGTPIILVERPDRSGKEWIHEVCPVKQ